jgi:hypothetical protein
MTATGRVTASPAPPSRRRECSARLRLVLLLDQPLRCDRLRFGPAVSCALCRQSTSGAGLLRSCEPRRPSPALNLAAWRRPSPKELRYPRQTAMRRPAISALLGVNLVRCIYRKATPGYPQDARTLRGLAFILRCVPSDRILPCVPSGHVVVRCGSSSPHHRYSRNL